MLVFALFWYNPDQAFCKCVDFREAFGLRRSLLPLFLLPEGQRVSAVVGSITDLTSDTRFAGNPPRRACSRTISSLGAM
jgi:hypothetical protein